MDLSYYSDTGGFDVGAVTSHGFDPYSDVGWFGSSLVKSIGKAVKKVVSVAKPIYKAVSPALEKALPVVQQGLKNIGPIGMAASGALGTMKAVLDGKKLKDVAIAAAVGAAPSGIDRALQVGIRVASGDNLLKIGLDELGNRFSPGTAPALAFDVGKKLITSGSPKEALANARRALTDEVSRRAFDTAIGAAALAGDKAGLPRPTKFLANATRRANLIAGNRGPMLVDVMPAPFRRSLPPLFPAQVNAAMQAMRNGSSMSAASRAFGAPVASLRRAAMMRNARPNWRPVSPAAASFVRRYVPTAPLSALRLFGRDTMGLVDNGAVYVVENGDFPGKIAKKLTGKENLWPQLIAANPQKKTKTTKLGKEFVTLVAGERLNVPKSWVLLNAPAPGGTPGTATPSTDTAAILQAKSLLVTWSKTDGLTEAGLTDYGTRPEDLSTTFGPRDKLVALAFEKWSNRVRGTKLTADGEMNPELSTALRNWAEARASLPVPPVSTTPASTPPASAPPVVVAPLPLPLPPVVTAPPASAPPASAPPVVALPFPLPPLPSEVPPVVLPVPAPPITTTPSEPTSPSKDSGAGDLALPAAGAIGGAMVGGPIGALLGAALGLAVGATK
jgi:hypothetical protein